VKSLPEEQQYKTVKNNKGLITIAIGKKYARQAKYLAYSAIVHSPQVLRAVVTDRPELLEDFYDIIIPYNPDYGDPFAAKTRLYLYSPFEKTLYIDADSLVMHNFDSYWESLDEHSFVYEGTLLDEGEWYFDIGKTIQQLSLPWMPKFNSGMFLFRKDEEAKAIFDTAYDYLENQKERNLGIEFFRGAMLPDEPFFAIALAKHGVKPVEDHERFSRTLIGARNIHVNVVKGFAFFIKNERAVTPLIVHFCGRFGRFLLFWQSLRLYCYFAPPVSTLLMNILSMIRKAFKK
jgi:CTP:phosphocholine cytidylyltransferase-like protein